MTTRLLFASIALALLFLAPAARGKERERMTATVCGAARCVAVSGLEIAVSDGSISFVTAKPTAFYTVRLELPTNVRSWGTQGRIVYVRTRGIWRVSVGGYPLWVTPPEATKAAFWRATRALRACPASRTWAC